MEKVNKIKLFVGLFYLIVVSIFLYFLFSKFSLDEMTSYQFIKNNRDFFFQIRQTNLILLIILFFLFTVVWVLSAGFGSPLALLAGFIFGKWYGTIFILVGLSFGATALYILANYFFKDLIKQKFLLRYKNLEQKFKKSEFYYMLIYRFIGGIPFAISNVLPCMFNVKIPNFFWATFIGIAPQIFLICSIGNGLEKIIDQNLEAPSMIDLIFSPNIYLPLGCFFTLIIITIIFRKIFYK